MPLIKQKQDNINIRVEPQKKKFLFFVAQMINMKLSAFMLESACSKAEEIVSSKTHFTLTEEQWQKFNEILDEPPRNIPQLKKLFEEKSIFDE